MQPQNSPQQPQQQPGYSYPPQQQQQYPPQQPQYAPYHPQQQHPQPGPPFYNQPHQQLPVPPQQPPFYNYPTSGGFPQQQQQPPVPPATNTIDSSGRGNRPSSNPFMGGGPRRTVMRPPYVDPNTQIIYNTDQAEYEGWLTKQSLWLREWRRRYFILKDSKLFFGKNEYAAPHGMIDLATCTTVKSADLKSKRPHSFEISTHETCFLLFADTEAEKDDWIGRVGKAIVRCSRTYYHQGSSSAPNAQEQEEEDDDIYENDDPDNPYFND